ncbi:DNA methylase [Niastella caeni]|uniref:Methyltransferase n=1 Tax=Niastella caeni TaxID=2569763 RepID=A0A4S8I436_9BACT|nr:DNA methyltransferase [Niastella caeni]THU41182.1 DNA methylase [Niastella caeni]
MKKFYLYKKNRRDYVPVEDESTNKLAKKKLELLMAGKGPFQIPDKFKGLNGDVALFNSAGNLDKATALYLIKDNTTYELSNKLNELTSKEWLTETVTVFSQKGLGANSKDAQIEKQHPAPFSFQDVAKLMRFFTKKGDKVLDPFNGVASTLKACAFEEREGYGIELNEKYYNLSIERIKTEVPNELQYKSKQKVIHGNSIEEIEKFEDDFFDFIITSPPYWNILETVDHKVKQTRISNKLDIKYSEDELDLANIDTYEHFIEVLSRFFNSCARKMKSKKYLAVIVSDFRKKEDYYIYHADLANAITKNGFYKLKGIRILYQRHKSIYPYGYPFTFVPNMHHQNVLIFQKIK